MTEEINLSNSKIISDYTGLYRNDWHYSWEAVKILQDYLMKNPGEGVKFIEILCFLENNYHQITVKRHDENQWGGVSTYTDLVARDKNELHVLYLSLVEYIKGRQPGYERAKWFKHNVLYIEDGKLTNHWQKRGTPTPVLPFPVPDYIKDIERDMKVYMFDHAGIKYNITVGTDAKLHISINGTDFTKSAKDLSHLQSVVKEMLIDLSLEELKSIQQNVAI